MRHSFALALAGVLAHEGGYVNHPRDPGGATNRGVTQTVYDDWRVASGLTERSVRDITDAEVMAIYKKLYWDKVKGDEMPAGVDYAVFDLAVNSGASRAARFLQDALVVVADGKIGPATLSAARSADPRALVDKICDRRMAFLKGLAIFDTFGKGWSRRVEDVRAKAKAMVGA